MLLSAFVLALVLIVAPVNGYDFVILKSNGYRFPRAHLLSPSADAVIDELKNGFTISFNFYPNPDYAGQTQTLISYASYYSGNDNELSIAFGPNGEELTVTIGGVETIFRRAELKENDWTNIIVTYNTAGGNLTAYIDGERKGKKNDFQSGYKLGLIGTLVLCQDQDDDYYPTYYEADDGCVGRISDVQIFKEALKEDDVKKLFSCGMKGTALSWLDSEWGLYDGGMVEPSTSKCAVDECGAKKAERGAAEGKEEEGCVDE